jgi:hypothetical protein
VDEKGAMTYEPGVLVRRQQREYPPELRQEIALAALEVGNNREVARLYSERLGYTVNESTVRGIKKRYLEGVQKGKIDSPGISPRGGDPSQSPRGSESEDGFQPEHVMKLQLEVLEGKMKESVGIENPEDEVMDDSEMADSTSEVNGNNSLVINDSVLNGEDSRDSSYNQLSIDIGESETEAPKPIIRIAKGLQKDPTENSQIGILAAQLIGSKRKSNGTNGVSGLPVKKIRPSAAETDAEIFSLEKEIRALQWLARRKEQEWDQAVRLLKQKEEKLMKAQRNKVMIQTEAEHLLTKYRQPSTAVVLNSPMQPVIVPQQQVLILPTNQPVTPTSRLIQPKPATLVSKPVINTTTHTTIIRNSKSPSPATVQRPVTTAATQPDTSAAAVAAAGVENTETKFSTVLEKASKNLQKASGGTTVGKKEEKKNTPVCQGCGKKKSEFVCAGCSNRWYCSRECQVEDWDEHADDCSG